jgi:hypothetical protein
MCLLRDWEQALSLEFLEASSQTVLQHKGLTFSGCRVPENKSVLSSSDLTPFENPDAEERRALHTEITLSEEPTWC